MRKGKTAKQERRKRALKRHLAWRQTLLTAPDFEKRKEAVRLLDIVIRNTETNLVK